MANGKSLYSAYTSAGASRGAYKASLYDMEGRWGEMEFASKKADWQREKTGRGVDAVQAGLELSSTAYGGYQDKLEFEEGLPRAEEWAAKKQYDPEEHGGMTWDDFQKSEGYADYREGFTAKEIKPSFWEGLFQDERMYQVGGKQYKKSELSAVSKAARGEEMSTDFGVDTSDVLDIQQGIKTDLEKKQDEFKQTGDTLVEEEKEENWWDAQFRKLNLESNSSTTRIDTSNVNTMLGEVNQNQYEPSQQEKDLKRGALTSSGDTVYGNR